MKSNSTDLQFRLAALGDALQLEVIRAAAFQPVFASFRKILGDEIYERAQQPEDRAQGEELRSILQPDSLWEVQVAELQMVLVGFVSIRFDRDRGVGEIGINAVHPDHAGRGIGTTMYAFALERMKKEGLKVATVATGGDPSHAPARRAYEKAGFDVQIPSVWMCRLI